MQRVQTQILLAPELVSALTCCKFGFHFLLEALWEWLTLCPKTGPFPQISQTFGIILLALGSYLESQTYTTYSIKCQLIIAHRKHLYFSDAGK
jgi:hypothetical protein